MFLKLHNFLYLKWRGFELTSYLAKPFVPSDKIKSPLRYPGGKFYALKHIMPYIECVPHDEYREPFFGGGSVFFAKKKVEFNVLNDLENALIEFYKVITDDVMCEKLISLLSSEVATRERHNEVKNIVPSTVLESVFKTYYLNRTSYCGIINAPAWGYAEGKSSPPKNWGTFINKAASKLKNTDLLSYDFEEVLAMPARGSQVLMYLDPPYYHADQRRAYTKPFQTEDHLRLASVLKETPYLFCLSYDDCQEIRDLYSWANIYDVSWLYNTDNKPGQMRKACNELVITNYAVIHN